MSLISIGMKPTCINHIMIKRFYPVILLSVFLTASLSAQTDPRDAGSTASNSRNVPVTLFDTDDVLDISIKFDINKYKRFKSDTMYLPAVLSYQSDEGDSVVKNIKLRARGNIRRTAICDFPPMMFNFKVKDVEHTEFAGINKLKIVPYCRSGYEQYVLKEYLVYKLFNIVTDYSLRVRLLRISYLNSVKEKKTLTQYGFAIEPWTLWSEGQEPWSLKEKSHREN